ncbi:uncharacterized protein [Watersipora subatra]|uniref:uncharacterized protein n=1 Tax=Watersipora subatra TaxID=2589382 RepID=UPI00355C549B
MIKGLNIALCWGIARLKIVIESASVYGWVRSVLVDSKKPKVSGLSEMVIKRRLGIISQLVMEYHIKMTIQLVSSTSNKADVLTRVPQKWLNSPCLAVVTLDDKTKEITRLHGKHHLGVKKTLYLTKRMCGQDVDEKVVKQVVDSCNQCRRVDPVSIKWNHERLSADKVWQRVAMDIAYVNKRAFLTLIDCGPSRFAMWRRLPNETASTVAKELHRIFLERGAPDEVLCDNGPCFRSYEMTQFFKEWEIMQVFCCAYKHSRNGIIEHNHRAIKRMVARTGGRVEVMVYWYNNSPNFDNIVPAANVYQYEARLLGAPKAIGLPGELWDTKANPYQAGDVVYVKPRSMRTEMTWKQAKVTRVVADHVVEMDGINRHMADVRPVIADSQISQSCDRLVTNRTVEYCIEDSDDQISDFDVSEPSNNTDNSESNSDSDLRENDTSPLGRDKRLLPYLNDFVLY